MNEEPRHSYSPGYNEVSQPSTKIVSENLSRKLKLSSLPVPLRPLGQCQSPSDNNKVAPSPFSLYTTEQFWRKPATQKI